jgi:hypothetical protein
MLDFNLEEDIPNVVPVWVPLLHIPSIYWEAPTFQHIDNNIGKFMDREISKVC